MGPSVVRELAGAMVLAGANHHEPVRGILVTTSSYSSGAMKAAEELGVELIDGEALARMAAP